jgi:hypothetical protein
MNLPSVSPNENMQTAASIRAMPASRAERSSAVVEIFARIPIKAFGEEESAGVPLSGCRKPLQRHSGRYEASNLESRDFAMCHRTSEARSSYSRPVMTAESIAATTPLR